MTGRTMSWVRSFEEAASQGSGRARLELELGRLLRSIGGLGAGLYVGVDSAALLELTVGEGEFPPRARSSEGPGQLRLALAGAHLLISGLAPDDLERGAEAPPDESVIAAAATAARAYLLEQGLKRERFEVNYRGVELEALYDVGLAIASTLNLKELSEEILLRAVSLLDARRGALYFVGEEGYRLRRTFGGEARERVAFDDAGVHRLLSGERAGEKPESQDLMPGAEHLLAAAIEVEGRPRGLLLMGDKESRHGVGPFGSGDSRTLHLFANQAAIALENAHLHRQALEKERLEREVELAADIQQRLLPATIPSLNGLELLGWSRPARHVGGDWYDFMKLRQGQLAAVVADVSGKGMPAALMVSTLYSAMRLLIDRTAIGPELVEQLNRHIFESSAPNKFITFFAAEVDPGTGHLAYVNAGHNPALVLKAGGEVEQLPSGGMPLGLFAGGRCEAGSLTMAEGDLLCSYTDGITEAESPQAEEFGLERLADLLRTTAGQPLGDIVAAVDSATSKFAAGLPQGDDQTVVLVRKI